MSCCIDYATSLNSKILEKAAKTYNLSLCLELEEPIFTYELRLLVGPEGHLRVLLYDDDYVAPLIEKCDPRSQTLVIRNLVSRCELNMHLKDNLILQF